jgi:hypothetical protein
VFLIPQAEHTARSYPFEILANLTLPATARACSTRGGMGMGVQAQGRRRLAALGAQGRRRLWRGGARRCGLAAVGVRGSARVRGAAHVGARLRAGVWLGRREALRGLWRGPARELGRGGARPSPARRTQAWPGRGMRTWLGWGWPTPTASSRSCLTPADGAGPRRRPPQGLGNLRLPSGEGRALPDPAGGLV